MSDQAPHSHSPLPSDLGEPLETFQPAMENLIAGYILMELVFIGGAVGLYFLIEHVIEIKGDMDFWQPRGKRDLSSARKNKSSFPSLFVPPDRIYLIWVNFALPATMPAWMIGCGSPALALR
ncbi:MAG TPA: hypothetical protein VKE98_11320 [Gemmataceae bacterium]|nr:hypothetical protein [Gemmataceae bacterium]